MAGDLRAEIPLQYADNGVNPGPGSGSHPMFHDFFAVRLYVAAGPRLWLRITG